MAGGSAKVTGAINYAPDLVLPACSMPGTPEPLPDAKLVHVDSTKAEKYSGVLAVVTRDDSPV